MKEKKKRVKKPIKVMVAIPNQGTISVHLAKSLLKMFNEALLTKKYCIDLVFSKVTCIDYNRNTITQQFLDSDNKWLLMIDDDNPCLKDPLDLIERNKDIIIYPTLMFKTDGQDNPLLQYNVFKRDKNMWRSQRMTPGKPFMQYDAGGTGCILIKRKVLEHPKMNRPFLSKLYPNGTREVGMDLWFCERARKLGFEIWADWEYSCSHHKEVGVRIDADIVLRDKSGKIKATRTIRDGKEVKKKIIRHCQKGDV